MPPNDLRSPVAVIALVMLPSSITAAWTATITWYGYSERRW
jgi:hypothetical protein